MLLPLDVMFLIVDVSEKNILLMPLSVFMLPKFLVLRKFESGNCLETRIDD